jgi:glycosyltransferase involved in cell wall biosynthesis
MSNLSDSPLIAVVIPLFKHSVLVADALESVLGQKCQFPFRVIVVNDGCPFQESDLQIKSIQAVHPRVVHYVVQRNRGLSAARNTGIDYALKRFQSIQAIYFLDADNTLLPSALNAAYSKLMGEPETSWIYPNIDMFGIGRNYDYSGPYSLFRHALFNICEAGSLVHRRLFDAGIRFDETMKLGYEDWDFWLTAAESGFRGAQHPNFGFCYRNRGESMLSQAHRDDKEIQCELQRKHAALLGRRGLMRLESKENLRYAIFLTDTNEVLLTSGNSENSVTLPQAEFDELFWRNIVIPTAQFVPPFFVFMTRPIFDELSQLGLILWVLHDCEIVLKDMTISCLAIDPTSDHSFEFKPGGKAGHSDVLALGRDLACAIIRDSDTNWIEQVMVPPDEMKVSIKTIVVPRRPALVATPDGAAAIALLFRIRSWRASHFAKSAQRPWIWRELTVPPPHALYTKVRDAFGGEVVYPAPSGSVRNIGFILPIASFGGVERVAYNLAQQFSDAGWRVHLFVISQTRIEIPREFASAMSSINFLNGAGFGGWDPNTEYQGTALSATRNSQHATNRIVAALAWLDAVVNCHSGDFHSAAADLRQLGVKTAAHLHLLDLTSFGRSVGHPILTLAYEHAYDLILCNSKRLMSWMHAAGIPGEKLLLVPNAPGHPVDAAGRQETLALRGNSPDGDLNVLYLGRLDRQKGIDRLAEVVRQTRDLDLPVNWRIVGSNVTGDIPPPAILQPLLEPAVFESQELTALFSWAHVLVLLSDYEGVPLSVLEAQRLGVIVIATNVGALDEMISNGMNGFLIESESAVGQTVGLLKLLREAPELRSRIAAAASQVIEWPAAAKELIDRLNAIVNTSKIPANIARVWTSAAPA